MDIVYPSFSLPSANTARGEEPDKKKQKEICFLVQNLSPDPHAVRIRILKDPIDIHRFNFHSDLIRNESIRP